MGAGGATGHDCVWIILCMKVRKMTGTGVIKVDYVERSVRGREGTFISLVIRQLNRWGLDTLAPVFIGTVWVIVKLGNQGQTKNHQRRHLSV